MADRSSGMVVKSVHPNLGLFALLSRRGTFNWEKVKPESFAYACQVTCHGKLEGDEDFREALFREVFQELGPKFAEYLRQHEGEMEDVSPSPEVDQPATVVTQSIFVEYDVIEKTIFADRGMVNFVPCTVEDARNIRVLDGEKDRKNPVTDVHIAMFADEMVSVIQALDDQVGS